MNNKVLSSKAAIFHKQNVPTKREALWDKFICCTADKTLEFENVPVSATSSSGFNAKHFSRVLDWLFVFGEYGIRYVDYNNCQLLPTNIIGAGSIEIKQTDKTDGTFMTAAFGQDGKLYFGSTDGTGIWYLDNDGEIKQTNITSGAFYCLAIGQNGKLYFGSGSSNSNTGLWYLDNDGQIKQTNKTDGAFTYAAIGQNGKLYFVGNIYDDDNNNGTGIWYLDNDDEIKQTNKTDGYFYFAALGQNGKLYFGGSNTGLCYLDNDGQIKQTNKTDGNFYFAATGQNGKLYFCGGSYDGIWYLDNDGEIKQTNKTNGSFQFAALGQDGKLYFCSEVGTGGNTGLWYLDNDGQIKQTNKTDGAFNYAALGQDGKLYFVGTGGIGLWYLDGDGDIKQTNITTGSFSCAALGQDGKLYFGATGGIWYLNIVPVLEFIWAQEAHGRIWFGGVADGGLWYSLLSDPFTIMQSNITTGTFTGIGGMGMGYYGTGPTVFLSSNGGYWFDSSDSQLKPHPVITADFKSGAGGYFYGGTGNYTGLWYHQDTHKSELDISGHTGSDTGSIIFFRNDGSDEVFEIASSGSITSIAAGTAFRGAISRQWMLYLATAQGLYNFSTNTLVNDDQGYAWIETGKDGYMYLCGINGNIYYWDDYLSQIVDAGKTGNYSESCVGADGKMYFAGGDVVRAVTNQAGNTGYSVAMELNLHRIKFSKDEIVESHSMLDSVAPEITTEALRKMSAADINLRAAELQANVNLSAENSHYSDTPDLCPIGERGFISPILAAKLVGVRDSGRQNNPYYMYNPATFGQLYHTWDGFKAKIIYPLYLDNISCWKSGRNKIELYGTASFNVYFANMTIGFIDLPPEEWALGSLTFESSDSTYSIILAKMNLAKHAVTYPARTPVPLDISNIYEGPEAKTLVMCSKTSLSLYQGAALSNIRIVVNGELLGFKLYTLMNAVWDNRVSGRAKTLTLTTAVSNQISEYSILDAFGEYPAITESEYTQMSGVDVRERAAALLEYATAGNAYKENNSVI